LIDSNSHQEWYVCISFNIFFMILADRFREKCGVFGVCGVGSGAARLVHVGLWALQHRGQESSGITASDGKALHTHRAAGLVAHVYDEGVLRTLTGSMAVGQNRYATSGKSGDNHLQPVVHPGGQLALAHNGNLPETRALKRFLTAKHVPSRHMNDSEMMHMALQVCLYEGMSIEQSVRHCFSLFTGVFSLVLMTDKKLVAVRDGFGVRPLVLGRLGDGYVVSSETCALDAIGASTEREILPGEMVVIENNSLTSYQLVSGQQKLDIFEFIYFARPDSVILGKRVHMVRQRLGEILALEHSIAADVVIPVPDSAIPAAIGVARVLGVPFDHGFVKNRYIHRTFIQPAQQLRERDVDLKLNIVPEVVAGKRVVVVDDSIVRGTTSKRIVQMVRRAGAREVHLLISSPPVKYPDFYGIDTPRQEDLLAARLNHYDLEQYVGADSVCFLSFEGMIEATELSAAVFSTACFTGIYPVPIGLRSKQIRQVA
jgi:amidophosphoribosyltransferase